MSVRKSTLTTNFLTSTYFKPEVNNRSVSIQVTFSQYHYLPFSGGFLGCKANVRRSVHSPQDHFIITLIISDRRDWRDTQGKWPLARNPGRSWWHRHTNWKFLLASAHSSMNNRYHYLPSIIGILQQKYLPIAWFHTSRNVCTKAEDLFTHMCISEGRNERSSSQHRVDVQSI